MNLFNFDESEIIFAISPFLFLIILVLISFFVFFLKLAITSLTETPLEYPQFKIIDLLLQIFFKTFKCMLAMSTT